MEIIRVKNVKKYYGREPNIVKALDGIDIIIEKGFTAIAGPSGSGKTTLLNLLGGLEIPTSGSVIVGYSDLSTLNDEQLTIFRRKNIGFIFQDYDLVPILNVFDNIVLPLELDGAEIDYEYIEQIIRMLSLENKIYTFIDQLSDGQQQRVAIARALSTKPKVILADEPTGRLDSKSSMDVVGLLKMTSKEFNQAIVIVTHNNELADLADTRIYIKDGMIVKIQKRRY